MILVLGSQLDILVIIEVLYTEKTSFIPSKWPQKFRNQKMLKIVNCHKNFLSQLE
jgi:hypothetical protein